MVSREMCVWRGVGVGGDMHLGVGVCECGVVGWGVGLRCPADGFLLLLLLLLLLLPSSLLLPELTAIVFLFLPLAFDGDGDTYRERHMFIAH